MPEESAIIACPQCGQRNRVPAAAGGIPRCAKCHQNLPWVVNAGDEDFGTVAEKARMPVLVDLWAPWCGPCRAVGPIVEELAAELAGRLKVVKVNVDEAPATSDRFQVRSIPTLLFLRGGQVVDKVIGAPPRQALRQWVQQSLKA